MRGPSTLLRGLTAALLGSALVALTACTTPSAMLETPDQVDLTAKTPRKIATRNDGPTQAQRSQGGRYEVFPGSSNSALEDGSEPPPGVGAQDDGKFTVNIDQATLAEAAKLILGETLGYNYTVDPRVQGTVTLVSNRPLNTRELLSAFEAALRLASAALIQSDGGFKVVGLQEVLDGEMGTADLNGKVSPGFGVSAIPLRYTGPQNMMELLDGFIARNNTVRATKVGNMILVRGAAADRRALVDVILSFDVDWMKNQTSSMVMLENGRAEDIASSVEKVFAQDSEASGPNGLKVIPVPSINALIAIANDQAKVKRAITWIRRMDRESIDAPNVFVYAVQNGNAVELAKILNATFGSGGGNAGTTAEVAPNKPSMEVSMSKGTGSNGQTPTSQPAALNPDGTQPPAAGETGDAMTTASTEPQGDTGGTQGGGAQGIRITPNGSNNTIVIRATPKDYRKILATLRQIDAPPTQVQISTMIAEVTLNDQLRYGVQAYFQQNGNSFLLTGASKVASATSVLSPSLPGMNFLLGGISNPKLVVDALSGITKVRIVSSPTIVVLENETATIKVGDQVPIQTQQLTTDAGNNVNSYEYRDTGVILKVKPRVSARGVVTIDLGQELSAAQKQDTINPTNPTITQRAISSKVSVNDQQTVLLGGLISGAEEGARNTVPGADKVPLLGKLVGTTNNTAKRTELIVFITPKIIRNGDDAAEESQALRDKMRNLNFK